MTRLLGVCGLAVMGLVLAGSVSTHQEDLADDVVKEHIVEFSKELRSSAKDDQRYADALYALGAVKHRLVAEFISGLLLKKSSVDHRFMAADVLSGFKKPKDAREVAGKGLLAAAVQRKVENPVFGVCLDGIVKLRFVAAIEPLGAVLERRRAKEYPVLRILKAFQKLKDKHALPALLRVWEKLQPKKSTASQGGGSLSGGSGGGMGRTGQGASAGGPAKIQRAFELTAKVLTGDPAIKSPKRLLAWMQLYREALEKQGISVPKGK